jgi:cobalamin biosynthesis Mg chelatase CobN
LKTAAVFSSFSFLQDHSECVPSHICELGRPLCQCVPLTARGRNAGAAAAAASRAPPPKKKRAAPEKTIATTAAAAAAPDDGARLTRASSKRQKVAPDASSSGSEQQQPELSRTSAASAEVAAQALSRNRCAFLSCLVLSCLVCLFVCLWLSVLCHYLSMIIIYV